MVASASDEPVSHSVALHRLLVDHFNLEEIQELCFLLGVRYEDLGGQTLSARVLALQLYLDRRGELAELIEKVSFLRPNVAWPELVPASPAAASPYKGLQYFTESDSELFYGRQSLVEDIAASLSENRFLTITGASGSGKSSLVRAGVLPFVRQGAIEHAGIASSDWSIHVITPGDSPLKALSATLTRDSESVTAMKTLLEDLRSDVHSLDLWVYRKVQESADGQFILLIVDQFEELFTQCEDPEERHLFIENLTLAAKSGGNFALLLVLRADFYAQALEYPSLQPLMETGQKIVGAMNKEELRQVIEEPAAAHGWHFQPGLVDLILRDLGAMEGQLPAAGRLPLLSHALLETWKRREGEEMTLAGYQAAGGVHRAIAATAQAVYTRLDADEKRVARRLMMRLLDISHGRDAVRRRAPLEELIGTGEESETNRDVLERFVDSRLVTVTGENAEVIHEALLREWPLLRDWLEEDREILRIQRQLTQAAESWQELGRDSGALYRGLRLTQAEAVADENAESLSDLEARFLVESRAALVAEELERQKERQIARQVLVYGMLGGAVAFSLSFFFISLPEVENRGLLLFLSLLRLVAGGLAGFFLIYFSDLVAVRNRQIPIPGQILSGLSGALVFSLLLIFDTILRSSQSTLTGADTSLIWSAIAGALWGFPAGLVRYRLVRRPISETLAIGITGLVCGVVLLVANILFPLFGEASLPATFIYGAVMPLGVLGAAHLAGRFMDQKSA